MRLIHTYFGVEIQFQENCACVLVIENPQAYAQCIKDFWMQCDGLEGGWLLSEGDKPINIEKKTVFISNPWAVNYNNKKILNRLYQELATVTRTQYEDRWAAINSEIVSYLDDLTGKMPYGLEFILDSDILGIFKLYDVKIAESDTELSDTLCTYIKLSHQIQGTELFVFVGLKSYFTNDQLVQLYQTISYEKVAILLLENHLGDNLIPECTKILDQDLCIIEVSAN